MYKNEIAFKNHERGFEVAKKLLEEEYVVMLSHEEDLLIVNWEWCEAPQADRNCIVFMPRYEYEEEFDKHYDGILDSIREDIKRGRIKSLNEI